MLEQIAINLRKCTHTYVKHTGCIYLHIYILNVSPDSKFWLNQDLKLKKESNIIY